MALRSVDFIKVGDETSALLDNMSNKIYRLKIDPIVLNLLY